MNLAERLNYAMENGPNGPMLPIRLAEKSGVTRSAISQVLDGKTRSLKSGNAIKISNALGIRVEWLVDEDGPMVERPPRLELQEEVVAGDERNSTRLARGTRLVTLRQYDVYASMGTGIDAQEHVEVVRMMQVNLSDLRRVLPAFTAPENLIIVTGLGDSMLGTFSDGDPIVVDRGVNDVTVDGVYVLMRDKEMFIKRLQRQLDGSLMMISDNKRYPPQHITAADRKTFDVFGRALGVWNFVKL